MQKTCVQIGYKHNNLTVIESLGVCEIITPKGNKRRGTLVKVLCICGKTKTVLMSQMIAKNHISCGCMNKGNKRHGLRHTKEYTLFDSMKKRCYNTLDSSYPRYGARGIAICDEWLNDFNSFYKWCNENGYKKGLQIDRIDNNGNYCPENCRFVTPKQNTNNRSVTYYIEYNGQKKSVSEWAEITGICRETIKDRIEQLGWTVEQALTKPIRITKSNQAKWH